MANPLKENSLLADSKNNPLISEQVATIADSAVTATLTAVDTGTDMTAAQAATIVTDLTDISTQLNLVIAALDAHGLTADA